MQTPPLEKPSILVARMATKQGKDSNRPKMLRDPEMAPCHPLGGPAPRGGGPVRSAGRRSRSASSPSARPRCVTGPPAPRPRSHRPHPHKLFAQRLPEICPFGCVASRMLRSSKTMSAWTRYKYVLDNPKAGDRRRPSKYMLRDKQQQMARPLRFRYLFYM